MTKKQKLAFLILAGMIVVQTGTGIMVVTEHKHLEDRYKDLYEIAAYFAGKAQQAGVTLDEIDLLNLKAMQPEEHKYHKG